MLRLSRWLARRPFGIGMAIGLILNLGLLPYVRGAQVAQAATACIMTMDDDPSAAEAEAALQAWVDVQQSVWAAAFGRVDEADALYRLDTAVTAPGLHEGQNRDGTTIWLDVAYCNEVTLPADNVTAWTVVARLIGPVGTVPIAGSVISQDDGAGNWVSSLVVGALVSDEAYAAIGTPDVGAPDINGGNGGSDGGSGNCSPGCVNDCMATAALQRDAALGVFALAVAAATAVLAVALNACYGALAIPGLGALIGGACGLAALTTYAIRIAAASLALAAAMLVIATALRNCLRGCGCTIAED
jgi:hypothetical protein